MFKTAIIFIVSVGVVILFARFGGTKAMGAHPYWAVKVALAGAPIGGIIGLVITRILPRQILTVLGFAILLAAAYATANYGKTEFAVSYGESVSAGKLWFFGWIGTCAALAALFTSLVPRSR